MMGFITLVEFVIFVEGKITVVLEYFTRVTLSMHGPRNPYKSMLLILYFESKQSLLAVKLAFKTFHPLEVESSL